MTPEIETKLRSRGMDPTKVLVLRNGSIVERPPEPLGESFGRALGSQLARGAAGLMDLTMRTNPGLQIGKRIADLIKPGEAQAFDTQAAQQLRAVETAITPPRGDNPKTEAAGRIAGMLLPAAAGPIAGPIILGGSEAGARTRELEAQGVSPTRAQIAGTASGAVTGLTSALTLPRALKPLLGTSKRDAALALGTFGAVTSGADQLGQNVVNKVIVDANQPILEGVTQATILGGGLGAGAGAAINPVARRFGVSSDAPAQQSLTLDDLWKRAGNDAEFDKMARELSEATGTSLTPDDYRRQIPLASVMSPETVQTIVSGSDDAIKSAGLSRLRGVSEALALRNEGYDITPEDLQSIIRDPARAVEVIRARRGGEVAGGNEAASQAELADAMGAARESAAARRSAAENAATVGQANAAAATAAKATEALETTTAKAAQQAAEQRDAMNFWRLNGDLPPGFEGTYDEAAAAVKARGKQTKLALEEQRTKADVYGPNADVTPRQPVTAENSMLAGAARKDEAKLRRLEREGILPPGFTGTVEEADALAKAARSKDKPIPEPPSYIKAQFEATLGPGTKAVTLLPPGSPDMTVPSGLAVVEVPQGLAVYNPSKVDEAAVKAAGAGEQFDGRLLGMSEATKPAGAAVVVATNTPEGTPVVEQATQNVPAAVKAGQAAVPGGVTEVKTPAETTAARVTKPRVVSKLEITAPSIASKPFLVTDTPENRARFEAMRAEDPSIVVKPLTEGAAIKSARADEMAKIEAERRAALAPTPKPAAEPVKPARSKPLKKGEPTMTVDAETGMFKVRDANGALALATDDPNEAKALLTRLREEGENSPKKSNEINVRGPSPENQPTATTPDAPVDTSPGGDVPSAGVTGGDSGTVQRPSGEVGAPKPSPEVPSSGLGIKPGGPLPARVSEMLAAPFKAIRPAIGRLKDRATEASAQYAARAGERLLELGATTANKRAAQADKILGGISMADRQKISQYLSERHAYGGATSVVLTPEQRVVARKVDDLIRLWGMEEIKDGPYINDGGKFRPKELKDFYLPETLRADIWRRLRKGDDKLRDRFLAHVKGQGMTHDAAVAEWDSLTRNYKQLGADVEFGPLRKPASYTMPPEWNSDVLFRLRRYAMKSGFDLAKHKVIEQDPNMAALVGDLSDGRGGTWTAPNTLPSGEIITPSTKTRQDIEEMMNQIDASVNPLHSEWFRVSSLFNKGAVQTFQAVKDAVTSAPAITRIAGAKNMARGLLDLASEYRNQVEAGQVRRHGTLTDDVIKLREAGLEDFLGTLNTVADMFQKGTGTEGINRLISGWGSLAGRYKAIEALADNDDAFFKSIGIKDWRLLPREELIARVGRKTVAEAQGAYDASDLPAFAQPGGGLSFLAPLMRWSTAVSNRQIDSVLKPAWRGDFKPLVTTLVGGALSAEVATRLVETFTDRGNRDMTWEEWINSERPKALRYLVQRVSETQLAPIFTSTVAMFMPTVDAKTPPQNVAQSFATKLATRLNQFSKTEDADYMKLADVIAQDYSSLYRALSADKPRPGEREKRIYEAYFGEGGVSTPQMPDAFSASREFNRAQTPEETDAAFGRLKATGKVPRVPSALEEPEFYEWLTRAQGSEAAAKQLDADRKAEMFNEWKRKKAEELRNAKPPRRVLDLTPSGEVIQKYRR